MNLYLQAGREDHLDIFTLYPAPYSIFCPSEFWFNSLATSLRMKRAVLILEKENIPLPVLDMSQRWEVSDNWSWLAPRALSVISKAYQESLFSFEEFKAWLKTHK